MNFSIPETDERLAAADSLAIGQIAVRSPTIVLFLARI
jgi:hypothetical protein